MKEKKKSNAGLIILVVVLLVLCAVMGAFIFMNKEKLISKESATTEEKATREDVDINSSLVTNLFNIFRIDKACYMNVKDINNTNYTRLRIAYDNLSANQDKVECSKVGATYNGLYCGSGMSWDDEISAAYNNDKEKFNKLLEEKVVTDSVKPKDLKAKFEELFGTDAEYKDEDFGVGHLAIPSCHIMHYDKKNDIYAQYSCEGGGTCGGNDQTLSKAYKEGDKLYIETNYTDPDGITDEGRRVAKGSTKVIYTFKKDKVNSNYVLVKAEDK